MNSSETITERSNVPEVYEVEIKVSPKFSDINFNLIGNDTTTPLNNDTFTFQGNMFLSFLIFFSCINFSHLRDSN